MNVLKIQNILFLIAITLLCGTAFSGCEGDPCESTACGQGNCKVIDGEAVCECKSGYERDAEGACNVFWYEKFLGTYTCTEERVRGTDTATLTYPVEIKHGGGTRNLVFAGLGGLNDFCDGGSLNVQVRLDSISEFTLTSPQTYCVGDPDLSNASIEGSGKLDGAEIVVDYRYEFDVNGSNFRYACKAVLRK